VSLQAWSDVAHNFRGDWQMLWKEIAAGFLVAGYVSQLPRGVFNTLFVTNADAPLRLVENVVVGPVVAALAFVCSIGNVPLAAVLWGGGISFSGVVAFLFADLLIPPILAYYRKVYGSRFATLLAAVMFGAIVAAALAVDGLFSAVGLVPSHRPSIASIAERPVTWNYTSVLDILFALVFATLVALTLRRGAKDPVCGMTVDRKAGKPTSVYADRTWFFCGAGCKARFDADPESFSSRSRGAANAKTTSHA
jgi:YHS domain-containing protein